MAVYDSAGNGLGLSYAGAAMPAGPGVAGLSFSVMDYGSYDQRDADGIMLDQKSVVDTALGLAFAIPNPPGLPPGWSGIAVERVSEGVSQQSLFGFSAGAIAMLDRRFSVGFAAQHLGPASRGFSLPAVVKGGASFRAGGSLMLALDVGYGLAEKLVWAAGGIEVTPSPLLVLRAGYKYRGEDLGFNGMTGLAAGAGFRFGRLGLDYAYQPFGDLATSHRIALIYGLGPSPESVHEEEWETRDIGVSTIEEKGKPAGESGEKPPAHLAAQVPSKTAPQPDADADADAAYRASVSLFSAGDYDGAWRKAASVLEANRQHWQAWQMVGNCQYAKGDKAGAIVSYRYSLALNPNNPALKSWLDQISK
jgi:tetratricopeptide (TPR) repeat protein